jgi:predicted Zn-dependent protease
MKKILFFLLISLCVQLSYAQRIRYDNGPIDLGGNFVTNGSWGRTNITFRFFNGTADIVATDEWIAVRQAFQIWADYAPFTFTEITSGTPDISITWNTGDHGDGAANAFDGLNGVLAHAFSPNPSNAGGLPGDVHFDDAEGWTNAERPNVTQPIDLVTVAAHEIGHALGLGHSDVACALMNPFYTGSHRYLAPDDIAGIRSLYGTRSPILPNTNNALCTSATFFFRNVPTGATTTWASSNTSLATANNQGVVTRQGNLNGTITLTGTLNLPCGLAVTETRAVAIGAPVTISTSLQGCSNGYQGWSINAGPSNFGSGWNWSVSYLGTNSQITIYSPSSPSTFVSVKGGGTLRLTYTDACGTARTDGLTVYSSCPPGFRISVTPNPAQNDIKVTIGKAEANNSSLADAQLKPLRVIPSKGKTILSLYALNAGKIVRQWVYNETSNAGYSLNVSGLQKGVYVLQADRNNGSTMTKLIIE